MPDQRPMTQQEWRAYLVDVRKRAQVLSATLTRDEWRDYYLAQAIDRVETVTRQVDALTRDLSNIQQKMR